MKEIDVIGFDEVIKTGRSLVDFYATWCPPCKVMTPILDGIENIRADLKFFKVNIDNNQDLTEKYNVTAVPTLILFEDGVEKSRKLGVVKQNELIDWFDSGKS